MAEQYCSAKFKCGADLDEALVAALDCCDNAERAEAARVAAETAAAGAVRTYRDLADIGCTTASTLSEVWAALPNQSVLLGINGGSLTDASWNLPHKTGFVRMEKTTDASRGRIEYISKQGSFDYRMFCASNSTPSGEWKAIATTDYAVNKAGDTMADNLTIQKSSYPSVRLDNTGSGSRQLLQNIGHSAYMTMHNVAGDNSNYRAILVSDSAAQADVKNTPRLLDVVNSVSTNYTILHTGNKPSGSYTGNGDATARTIATGGIGSVIAIWSTNSLAIIGPQGGVVHYTKAETFGYFPPGSAKFVNGVLTLATAASGINVNGYTYDYQVP